MRLDIACSSRVVFLGAEQATNKTSERASLLVFRCLFAFSPSCLLLLLVAVVVPPPLAAHLELAARCLFGRRCSVVRAPKRRKEISNRDKLAPAKLEGRNRTASAALKSAQFRHLSLVTWHSFGSFVSGGSLCSTARARANHERRSLPNCRPLQFGCSAARWRSQRQRCA